MFFTRNLESSSWENVLGGKEEYNLCGAFDFCILWKTTPTSLPSGRYHNGFDNGEGIDRNSEPDNETQPPVPGNCDPQMPLG